MARPGDGGEVVREKNHRVRGGIVHIVLHGVGGSGLAVILTQHISDVPAVKAVGQRKTNKNQNNNKSCIHLFTSF